MPSSAASSTIRRRSRERLGRRTVARARPSRQRRGGPGRSEAGATTNTRRIANTYSFAKRNSCWTRRRSCAARSTTRSTSASALSRRAEPTRLATTIRSTASRCASNSKRSAASAKASSSPHSSEKPLRRLAKTWATLPPPWTIKASTRRGSSTGPTQSSRRVTNKDPWRPSLVSIS